VLSAFGQARLSNHSEPTGTVVEVETTEEALQ
jgi:hypothetical protein